MPILRALLVSDLWSKEESERAIKNTFASVYDMSLNHPAREQILLVPGICKAINTRLPGCFSWLTKKLSSFQIYTSNVPSSDIASSNVLCYPTY